MEENQENISDRLELLASIVETKEVTCTITNTHIY